MPIIPNVTRATFSDAKKGTDRSKLLTPAIARVAARVALEDKEVSTVNFAGKTAADLRGKHFQIDSVKGLRHVYFDRTDVSSDPAIAAKIGIKIDTGITGKNLNAGKVASLLKTFFNTDGASDYLSDWTSGPSFYLEAKTAGARTDLTAGNSGITFEKTVEGAAIAKASFSVTFSNAINPSGEIIAFEDLGGKIYFWLQNDGHPELAPEYDGVSRPIPFFLYESQPATGVNLATNFAASVNGDGQMTATRVGAVVTVTSKVNGFIPDANTDAPYTAIATITNGSLGTKEKYFVTIPADVSAFNGKYFLATFNATAYYVWFYGADPAPNSLPVSVISTANENGTTLAFRAYEALNATGDFSAMVAGDLLTVRNVSGGVRKLISQGTSGLIVARSKLGAGLKSLRLELRNGIDDLAGNVIDYPTQKPRLSASNPGTPSFTKNAAFFVNKSLSHIPFYAQNGFGSLVSPSHVICATHYPPSVNSAIYFEKPTGGFLARTVSARADNVGGSDICLVTLNAALPAEVIFARVFPKDFGGKISDYNMRERFSLLNLDQNGYARVFNYSLTSNKKVYVEEPFEASLSALYSAPQGGDSGSALFCYVRDVPVLVSTFYSNVPIYAPEQPLEGLARGYGPSISEHLTEINAAMTAAGRGEQLTVINLDEFDV